MFIKDLLIRKTALTPDELVKCKQQLIQFITDVRELLKTIKSSSYKVTYSQMTEATPLIIDLSGLVNGYFFCASGTILNNEVMTPLGLTATSDDSKIRTFINDLCDDHQTSLLASETIELRERLLLIQSEKSGLTRELEQELAKSLELEKTKIKEKETLTLALEQERAKLVEQEMTKTRETGALALQLEQARAKLAEQELTKTRETEALALQLEQARAKLAEQEITKTKEKEALILQLEQAQAKLSEQEITKTREKVALERELELAQSKIKELEEAARLKTTLVSSETQTSPVADSEELIAARNRVLELETTISRLRAQVLQKASLPIFRTPGLMGLYNPLLFQTLQAKPRVQGVDDQLDSTAPEHTM